MSYIFLAPAALQQVADPNQFNNYLLLGYSAMWLIGMLYVLSLIVRQRNLDRDLDLMEDILQEDDQINR
jgi:CcmD family protein